MAHVNGNYRLPLTALDTPEDRSFRQDPSRRTIVAYERTFSEVLDVVLIETGHGDTAVSGHVNVSLFGQGLRLCRVQASEAIER